MASDGRWSASISERGTYVWDHARGEGRWLGSLPSAASFDSRNTRLAIGRLDGEVNVWDPATGRPLGWRMKPGGMIYSARFDRDDRYLATGSMDASARVWDVAGRPVSPRLRHEGPIWSTQFSPDNRTIASGGGGAARIWDFGKEGASRETLVRLAEILSGHRFDASMAPVPLTREDFRAGFDQVKKDRPSWFTVTPEKEAQWERSAAEWAVRAGRAGDAARHYDRVVALEPSRAMAWAERGSVRAQLQQWDGAIADFEQAIELRPDSAEHVRDLALARLGRMDEAGYRRACADLRARFGTTGNPDRALWIARACALLAPANGDDVSWLVRAAERAVEFEPDGVRQLETLGAAMMRAGNPGAASALRRALQAAPKGRDAWSFLLLAILEGKEAPQPCDRSLVEGRSGTTGAAVSWRERVEVDALLREWCTAARH